MSVRVILVDDHPIVRQGLRRLLESEPELQVIAESGDGLEAVQLVERYKPDVLIVDLMMPGLNGLEVTRQVCQRLPYIRVVVLSMHKDDDYIVQALRNGAMGYVIKDTGPSELAQAVREVTSGRRYLSPQIAERLVDRLLLQPSQLMQDPYELLTSREREVLQLVAEGFTSPEIAQRLTISRRTAEQHRANLMHKLGLQNQREVLRYALRKGILQMDL